MCVLTKAHLCCVIYYSPALFYCKSLICAVNAADAALADVRLTSRAQTPSALSDSKGLCWSALGRRESLLKRRIKSKESKGSWKKALLCVWERLASMIPQLGSWPQGPLGRQHCNSIQVKHAQLLFPFWGKGNGAPPPWTRLCLTSISLSLGEGGQGCWARPAVFVSFRWFICNSLQGKVRGRSWKHVRKDVIH